MDDTFNSSVPSSYTSEDMHFDWGDAMLSPISDFLITEARQQRFDPQAFVPNLPVLVLLQEEAERYRAN